jgi:hypothetical protein
MWCGSSVCIYQNSKIWFSMIFFLYLIYSIGNYDVTVRNNDISFEGLYRHYDVTVTTNDIRKVFTDIMMLPLEVSQTYTLGFILYAKTFCVGIICYVLLMWCGSSVCIYQNTKIWFTMIFFLYLIYSIGNQKVLAYKMNPSVYVWETLLSVIYTFFLWSYKGIFSISMDRLMLDLSVSVMSNTLWCYQCTGQVLLALIPSLSSFFPKDKPSISFSTINVVIPL